MTMEHDTGIEITSGDHNLSRNQSPNAQWIEDLRCPSFYLLVVLGNPWCPLACRCIQSLPLSSLYCLIAVYLFCFCFCFSGSKLLLMRILVIEIRSIPNWYTLILTYFHIRSHLQVLEVSIQTYLFWEHNSIHNTY